MEKLRSQEGRGLAEAFFLGFVIEGDWNPSKDAFSRLRDRHAGVATHPNL